MNNRPTSSSNNSTDVQNSSISCDSVIEFDQLSSRLIVTAISPSKRLLLLISYPIQIPFQFPVYFPNSLPQFYFSSLRNNQLNRSISVYICFCDQNIRQQGFWKLSFLINRVISNFPFFVPSLQNTLVPKASQPFYSFK